MKLRRIQQPERLYPCCDAALVRKKKGGGKREKMASGYQKMGPLNLELAEEGISEELAEIDRYLDTLAVGESS